MNVIIDCDPGNGIPGANVDDGLAIGLAVAAADRIELRAITVVGGNTTARVGHDVAKTLLADLGLDIPVHLGVDRATNGDPNGWRARLDAGSSDSAALHRWQQVARPRPFVVAADLDAAHALGKAVTDDPGTITIVAIGPLTNLALALQLYPTFAGDVDRIVIMGGVFDVPGYSVDTNFGYDPDAAATVLASGAEITLIPLDASIRTLLTHHDLDALQSLETPLTTALLPTLRPWVTHSMATRGIAGMWIHDVVAIALLLDPSIVVTQPTLLSVDLAAGPSRGHLRRCDPGDHQDPGASKFSAPAPIDVVTDIDNDRLVDLITTLFGRPAAGANAETAASHGDGGFESIRA